MNDWQSTYLGRGALPRDLSGFELEAFFTYSESERRVIDDEWRTPSLKLALALQIGFLRMTGRLLEALRLVPPSANVPSWADVLTNTPASANGMSASGGYSRGKSRYGATDIVRRATARLRVMIHHPFDFSSFACWSPLVTVDV